MSFPILAAEDRARADVRVLDALDTPRTVAEVEERLRHEVYETWLAENGYPVEYNDQGIPTVFGAALLSIATSAERGLPHVNHQQIYGRLRKFERMGLVSRVSVPGRKAVLWARVATRDDKQPSSTGECTLLTRRYRVTEGVHGKRFIDVKTDAEVFPDDDALVAWIEEKRARELPAEADGNPRFVPDEVEAIRVKQTAGSAVVA
ncbi:MAG: hypothetical protein M3540_12285 [Actinomycetota bacterium]|nr:hypothetical protein [Actinomycetota bacterium]